MRTHPDELNELVRNRVAKLAEQVGSTILKRVNTRLTPDDMEKVIVSTPHAAYEVFSESPRIYKVISDLVLSQTFKSNGNKIHSLYSDLDSIKSGLFNGIVGDFELSTLVQDIRLKSFSINETDADLTYGIMKIIFSFDHFLEDPMPTLDEFEGTILEFKRPTND